MVLCRQPWNSDNGKMFSYLTAGHEGIMGYNIYGIVMHKLDATLMFESLCYWDLSVLLVFFGYISFQSRLTKYNIYIIVFSFIIL